MLFDACLLFLVIGYRHRHLECALMLVLLTFCYLGMYSLDFVQIEIAHVLVLLTFYQPQVTELQISTALLQLVFNL